MSHNTIRSIEDLSSVLQNIVEEHFQNKAFWVSGVVKNVEHRRAYDMFDLCGDGTIFRCIAEKSSSDEFRSILREGEIVEVKGCLAVYKGYTRFQLSVEEICAPAPEQNRSILSVSTLTTKVNDWLLNKVQGYTFTVRGLVTKCKPSHGKYMYFDLADNDHSMRCIVFEPLCSELSNIFVDQAEVAVKGTLELYGNQARIQLNIQNAWLLEQNLPKAYRDAIRRLEESGLWPKRERHEIPKVITRIGLITSKASKAWEDFHATYTHESGKAAIEDTFTSVKGKEAPQEIAAAINRFSQSRSVDAIVITRGGGSEHEIGTVFNDYRIAVAICQSVIPVITAIGHTSDQTFADEVADLSLNTPTGAAVTLAKIPAKRGLFR